MATFSLRYHFLAISVAACLVAGVTAVPQNERTDLSSFFEGLWYKLTGNFEIVNPFPHGLTRWKNWDVWFSREEYEDDWYSVQPIHFYGHGNIPVLAMVQTNIADLLNDVEHIVRDVVELLIQIWRLIRCLFTGWIWDTKWMERPMTNRRAKWEMTMSKRESILDRLLDWHEHDCWITRCLKRFIEKVLCVLWYIVKVLYFKDKCIGRGIVAAAKLAISLIHIVIPSLAIAIDGTWCFIIGSLWSEKLALGFKDVCSGIILLVPELIFDVLDLVGGSHEIFVEGWEIPRLLVHLDDRINTNELEWISNMTYWRIADTDDKERWDATSRIDKYYQDMSAMIQSNELKEDHDTDWSRNVLMRTKEEWAQAMFMPPVDSPGRVEFKINLLSKVIKNDHRLDVGEARILAIYPTRALAYQTDPEKNTPQQIERAIYRMLDIVGAFPRLKLGPPVKLADQDAFLQGVYHMLRQSFHYTCLQVPPEFNPILEKVAQRTSKSLDKVIKGAGCPGTSFWRQRVQAELLIFCAMVGAGNCRVDALDCKDQTQSLRLGGPYSRDVAIGSRMKDLEMQKEIIVS